MVDPKPKLGLLCRCLYRAVSTRLTLCVELMFGISFAFNVLNITCIITGKNNLTNYPEQTYAAALCTSYLI